MPSLTAETQEAQATVLSTQRKPAESKLGGTVPLALVLLASFLSYARTLKFKFVFDDLFQIVGNPHLATWSYLPLYFTQHMWSHLPAVVASYYRPAVLVWFKLNQSMFGFKPLGWHLTTILLHLIVTGLVYVLAKDLLHHKACAIAAAAIFGLHPAHIESVAWVSGVTDPLCSVFLIGCYLLFRRYRTHGKAWQLAGSLMLFAMALLTKETAVILPAVLFADAALYEKRSGAAAKFQRAVVRVLPFVALVAIHMIVRTRVLRGGFPVITEVPGLRILATAPSLLWFYFTHLLLPMRLSSFYDLEIVRQADFGNFYLPVAGLIASTALAVYGVVQLRKQEATRPADEQGWRLCVISALLMVLPLLPVLNIRLFQAGDFAHDRYLYLPSIGFVLAIGAVFRYLRQRAQDRVPAWQLGVLGFIAFTMIVGIVVQSSPWRDDISLYSHAAEMAPRNPVPNGNLAGILLDEGHPESAFPLVERLIRYNPDYIPGYVTAGDVYLRLLRLDEAEAMYKYALAHSPNSPNRRVIIQGKLDLLQRVRQQLESWPKK